MFWNWQPILPQRLRSSINASTYSTVDRIDSLEESMKALDDTRLRRLGRSLSYRARAGEPTDELLIETFAATREAGRRTLGMRHYDVQLLAGIALVHGSIVEMQTGEGKTLVATLPLMLYALAGRGAHLATVNDYLAKRDAEWMQPIFNALGLTVGIVESEMDFDARRNAYAKDVTYGTAKEFGFDFLKDRLMQRELKEGRINLGATLMGEARSGDSKLLQRPYWFVLVDEADNVLIDEARTPLIISSPDGEMGEREQRKAALFHFACKLADTMVQDVHFEYDPQKRSAELLGVGRSTVRASIRPRLVDSVSMLELPPMAFSQSVHNTAAGLTTIAAKAPIPLSSIASGVDTFHNALIEAYLYLSQYPEHKVMVIDFDQPLPELYKEYETQVYSDYALGLVLSQGSAYSLNRETSNVESQETPLPQGLLFLQHYLNNQSSWQISGKRQTWSWVKHCE